MPPVNVPSIVMNPERDPDLPPMPDLPPANTTRERWFMRALTAQPAYFGPAVTEYARAYGKLCVEAERARVAATTKD